MSVREVERRLVGDFTSFKTFADYCVWRYQSIEDLLSYTEWRMNQPPIGLPNWRWMQTYLIAMGRHTWAMHLETLVRHRTQKPEGCICDRCGATTEGWRMQKKDFLARGRKKTGG